MDNKLFREKSIKKLSSPENLSEYLRVTTPAMWAVLIGAMLCVLGLYVWSYFMTIDSYVYGEGVVKNGILTVTYEDSKAASYVNEDMDVIIGEISVPIDSIGKNNKGETFTISHTDFPDGEYAAKASFKQVRMISMLLN